MAPKAVNAVKAPRPEQSLSRAWPAPARSHRPTASPSKGGGALRSKGSTSITPKPDASPLAARILRNVFDGSRAEDARRRGAGVGGCPRSGRFAAGHVQTRMQPSEGSSVRCDDIRLRVPILQDSTCPRRGQKYNRPLSGRTFHCRRGPRAGHASGARFTDRSTYPGGLQ